MPLQFRRDTTANITQFNPVLKSGEPLWDIDEKKLYIGDGTKPATELDSITGVAESDVAAVLNGLLSRGSSPNISFVYNEANDAFDVTLDFTTPFDNEIVSTVGFSGSLRGSGAGDTVVFEASENAFVNLSESFLTTIGPRTDNAFDIGTEQKRFDTGFFYNIDIKDQTVVDDIVVKGLITAEDSTILFDSRTGVLSANVIKGDLFGSVFGDDSSVIVDSNTGEGLFNRISISNTLFIENQIITSDSLIELRGATDNPPIVISLESRTPSGVSVFTGSPHTIELRSSKDPAGNSSDINSGDILGGYSLAAVQANSEESFNFLVWQADPNQTTTASHVPGKFFIVNSGTTPGTISYISFDSTGKMGVGVENPEATIDIDGFAKLAILTSEPANPSNGMIAIADGTNWNPLSNGKQTMVVYLGGGWRQIAVEP